MRKGNDLLAKEVLEQYKVELVVSEMKVYEDIREFIQEKRTDKLSELNKGTDEVDLMNELLKDENTFEVEGTYIYCEVWEDKK